MITVTPFSGLVYRACSLEYYRAAFGGKGSRLRAGRFNRSGEPAVYLATDVQTAHAKFQGSNIDNPQPCAVIAARPRARNLIDLSTCPADIQAWNTDWKDARDEFNRGIATASCASWRCRDLAVNDHLAGFLYPSMVHPGGRNIVFYPEDATTGDITLEAIDDLGVIGRAAKGVV